MMTIRKGWQTPHSKTRGIAPSFGLKIPEGTQTIREREYEKNASLTWVEIPGTVKRIESRAFADCPNLSRVILREGVVSIAHNVFTGCGKLESIELPQSVTDIEGWAFYESGLKEPVFNAHKDKLIFCPKEAAGSSYAVPEGIREIGVQAFLYLSELREVLLPEGLEVIRNRAFIDCGFQEILLPDSVKTVEPGAFEHCKNLKEIRRTSETDLVRERRDSLRMRNRTFFSPCASELPVEKHWKTREFAALAKGCSLGKTEAIQAMADYFERKAKLHPEIVFYRQAFHFWIYRAWEWGSKGAKGYLEAWVREHAHDTTLVSPYLSERLSGSGDGTGLRALGFFFFQEGQHYNLSGMDADGVVEVSAWVDEDGPDEDGFGREEYYDYWYLDDCLNLPPKGKCLHSYSSRDRRMEHIKERFQIEQKKAAKAVKMHGGRKPF